MASPVSFGLPPLPSLLCRFRVCDVFVDRYVPVLARLRVVNGLVIASLLVLVHIPILSLNYV